MECSIVKWRAENSLRQQKPCFLLFSWPANDKTLLLWCHVIDSWFVQSAAKSLKAVFCQWNNVIHLPFIKKFTAKPQIKPQHPQLVMSWHLTALTFSIILHSINFCFYFDSKWRCTVVWNFNKKLFLAQIILYSWVVMWWGRHGPEVWDPWRRCFWLLALFWLPGLTTLFG